MPEEKQNKNHLTGELAGVNAELIPEINTSLEIALSTALSFEGLQIKLTEEINHLINQNFEKLVYYLYRIDVHEDKMRKLLEKSSGENAASIIADLIIERQLQKIKTRNESKNNTDIPEDEKW